MKLIQEAKYSNHPSQRGAAHVWYEQCAEVLNAHGITILMVVEAMEKYGVSWTKEAFKEVMYKTILRYQKNIKSTEGQSTTDPGEIEREIANFIDELFHVELPPWPDRFNRQ